MMEKVEEEEPEKFSVSETATAFVVTKETEWNWALRLLKEAMGEANALGLDVEYLLPKESQPVVGDPQTPNDRQRLRNISLRRDPLLQLGAPGIAILVRLCFFNTLPKSLISLLGNKRILKLGVDILEDAYRLKAQWKLGVHGCLDLRHACLKSKRFMNEFHFDSFNLKSIGAFFHEDIEFSRKRDWRVACSNWAAPRLTEAQILYSAKDALAAAGSYVKLVKEFFDVSNAAEQSGRSVWSYVRKKILAGSINRPYTESKNGAQQAAAGGRNPHRYHRDMKPKQYRRLQDDKEGSDSDMEFDFQAERARQLRKMKTPNVVWFQRSETTTRSEAMESPFDLEAVSNSTSCSDDQFEVVIDSASIQPRLPLEESRSPREQQPVDADVDRSQDDSSSQYLSLKEEEEEEPSRLSLETTEYSTCSTPSTKNRSEAVLSTVSSSSIPVAHPSSSSEEPKSKSGWDCASGAMGGVLGVEKELLDWCITSKVPQVVLTVRDKKVDGRAQRYRVKLTVVKAEYA